MKKLALLFLLVLPMQLRAQACELISSRQAYSVSNGEVIYVGQPVFGCQAGTRITADSAIIVKASSRADFIGNVNFADANRTLTSQYAQYLSNLRKLQAQGNVIVRDKTDGSILRAPSLDYFQESPTEKQARIEIYSGRPHATLMRKRSNGPGIDTTNVDSDRMQLVGQNTFRGWGAVVVTRGKLNTRSGFAEFVQDSSRMKLTGQAVVTSDTVTLKADTIDGILSNGDEFKDMYARKDASLDSKNIQVTAPRLRVSFDKGQVNRLIAVGGKLAANGPQAKAVSEDFTLIADSIDAKTPNQKLDTVTAIGAALAQRSVDSLDAKLPDLIKRDWVKGENIVATFEDADTARVLKRILAKGDPASSTYRMREKDKKNPKAPPKLSVNYLTAKTIDVRFKKGDVDKVRAEGQIRGMYLQPPDNTKTK